MNMGRLAIVKVPTFVPNDAVESKNHRLRGINLRSGGATEEPPAELPQAAPGSHVILLLTVGRGRALCLEVDGSRRLLHRLGQTRVLSPSPLDPQ